MTYAKCSKAGKGTPGEGGGTDTDWNKETHQQQEYVVFVELHLISLRSEITVYVYLTLPSLGLSPHLYIRWSDEITPHRLITLCFESM